MSFERKIADQERADRRQGAGGERGEAVKSRRATASAGAVEPDRHDADEGQRPQRVADGEGGPGNQAHAESEEQSAPGRSNELSIQQQEEEEHEGDGQALAESRPTQVSERHEDERSAERDDACSDAADPLSEQVDERQDRGVSQGGNDQRRVRRVHDRAVTAK